MTKVSSALLLLAFAAAPAWAETDFPYRAIAQMSKQPQPVAASEELDSRQVASAIRGIATGANPPRSAMGTRKALDGSKVPKEIQFGTPSGK